MLPAGSVWSDTLAHLRDLLIAYVLALPVGWSWERKARSAGLRTYPLVAIASCGFVLLAWQALGPDPQSQARVLQGLITGIGFLAAGAVLREGASVRGTANAASIWLIGAAGAAVGYGLYDIAVILSVVAFATLWLLTPLKHEIEKHAADEHEANEHGEHS